MSGKEAVVYILDASPSMNKPYPASSSSPAPSEDDDEQQQNDVAEDTTKDDDHPPPPRPTRLSCAKQALEHMISELMIHSKQSEVCVIVCKTRETSHHKISSGMDVEEEEEEQETDAAHVLPFANLTELCNGVTKPSFDLLRRIWQVETVTEEEEATLKGDFCDAIILAADALYERTAKRKYTRKIVLLTDAEQDVVMDVQQTLLVTDSLRSMDCRLEVIGLDFGMSGVYNEPAKAETAAKIKEEDKSNGHDNDDDEDMQQDEEASETEDEEASETEDEEDDEEEEDAYESDGRVVYTSKEDKEKLLLSLTEKTGGVVVAASTMQQVLQANKGKKIKKAVARKFELRVAPGLVAESRALGMMKKETYSDPHTMKITTEAVMIDEDNKPMVNALDQEMMEPVKPKTLFVDEEKPEDVVEIQDRTKAIRFGADLIPMSTFDEAALKKEQAVRMDILGYKDQSEIPSIYMVGPPYAVSGKDSQKACSLIAALAQALDRLNKAAICTYYKTSRSDPVLGALFPLPNPEYLHTVHLVFLQLPFAGDVKHIFMDPLESDHENESSSRVCDDLIDALMLPNDVLNSGTVPFPYLRSWNQTLIKRAMDPKVEIVPPRGSSDQMTAPSQVIERAKPALQSFHEAFPLVKSKKSEQKEKKGRKGKRVLTYKDYL